MAKTPSLASIENKAVMFARTGKIEKLADCLAQGVSPNLPGLIQNAAERGRLEAVEFLLARGADLNQRDEAGDTALHHAAATGRLGIVQTLLARGADPNARDNRGATPLHYAREHRRGEVISALEPVTSMRIGYAIDTYLRDGSPMDAYYDLYHAITGDFARGLSPAELGVISLGSLIDVAAHNGLLTMALDCGLSSLGDAATLMDAIDEPELALLLREGDAVIREEAVRSGVDSETLAADDSEAFDRFHRDASARLDRIDSRVLSLSFLDAPDGGLRLYAKTLAYVRDKRALFVDPE